MGQLASGTKGVSFKFTEGLYKKLNFEILNKNDETGNKFIGQFKLSSGTMYFENSPWNKIEFLDTDEDGTTTYVLNTYDEMKYWVTAFIRIKTN